MERILFLPNAEELKMVIVCRNQESVVCYQPLNIWDDNVFKSLPSGFKFTWESLLSLRSFSSSFGEKKKETKL